VLEKRQTPSPQLRSPVDLVTRSQRSRQLLNLEALGFLELWDLVRNPLPPNFKKPLLGFEFVTREPVVALAWWYVL
jgi:hypothetical protein